MKSIIAENYLCFFAVLEMILKDIGYKNYNQYNLANYLGVVLPPNIEIKGVNNVSFGNSESDYGYHLNIDKLGSFFKSNNIPLTIEYISANPFGNYPGATYIFKEKYVIVFYSYGSLYREPQNYDISHASLLMKNEVEGKVEIYDPGPRNSGAKTVLVSSLRDAIYDSEGGVLILSLAESRGI